MAKSLVSCFLDSRCIFHRHRCSVYTCSYTLPWHPFPAIPASHFFLLLFTPAPLYTALTSFSVCSRTPLRLFPLSLSYSPCSVSPVPAGQKPPSHLPSDINTVVCAAYMLPVQSHDASQTPPPSRLGARLHDAPIRRSRGVSRRTTTQ